MSIVIPAPADVASLEETLVSVLEKRPVDAEVIVALGCPYDDPWGIADEVTFVRAPVGSSLVACVNVGVAASRAEVVHILAAGWRATVGWTDGPLARFDDAALAAVVPLTVAADDHARPLAAGIRCTRGGRRIEAAPGRAASPPHGPVLEAGFWRAEFLRRAGPGFTTACGDACADADMAVALARGGGRVDVDETSRVVAGPARPAQSPFLAGLRAERLFWRSLAGQSLPVALAAHALEVLRHALARAPLGTLPALAGRCLAVLQFGSYLPRYRRLHDLLRAAREAAAPDDPPTIRIDGPHSALPRPRASQPQATPLRRSA
ncbi:MAG: hypothetical protein EBZ74_04225 [Planctomycetia bacterium]|nr:hypothetical protein [Planctomycetia bacterium]